MSDALGSTLVHSGEPLNRRDERLLKKPKSEEVACVTRGSGRDKVNTCSEEEESSEGSQSAAGIGGDIMFIAVTRKFRRAPDQ